MATLANADRRSRFFVWMAAFALLIAVAGFAPTYWLPMVGGRSFPPILHIHGTIFLAWNSLYLWQCWLVATNRTADHRQWGLVGISVATAMVISVLLAIHSSYATAAAIGMEPAARQFSSVPFTGILLFAALFVLAIRNVRKPDVHRRYMYATLVPLLQAAVARWFQVALSPPGAVGPPPAFVAIPPGLLVSALFFIPLVLHDRRAFGHVHRTSWIVIAATLLVQLSPIVLAPTGLWAAFTEAFAGLAPRN